MMKLLERWIFEAMQELVEPFTISEIRDSIISKKGRSNFIGSDTQIAAYCRRYGYKVSRSTYRRNKHD